MAKFGLSYGINSTTDFEEELQNIFKKDGADVVIDTTGITNVIEKAYEITHKDGKTILVGVPKRRECFDLYFTTSF